MRTLAPKTLLLLSIHFMLSLFLFSCSGGQSGGFAPGKDAPVIQPIQSNQNFNVNMSQSKKVTTANGWAVQADNVSPVHTKILSNGWKIEAQYE